MKGILKKGRERLTKRIPLWLWHEHLVRYNFAGKFVAGADVIDCACGSGIGSEIFLQNNAQSLCGLDFSDDAIKSAKKRCDKYTNAKFFNADATSLPVADNSTDIFISLETIEHIKNDNKFLAEVDRVLRLDGVFICSTPNRTISNPEGEISDAPWNKFHVREYSLPELGSFLRAHFKIVEPYGFNRVSKSKLKIFNKIRKMFRVNGYIWFNIIKAYKIFFDNFEKYEIEKVNENYEYEYLIFVCKK